ncbi:helix-turn-helix transcriptional regulator [Halorubrum kocurii]|uniref:DNA binding domain-containing protein n=1 Tax=Halorubrum kocurii JCM 14978 TaxID=1230456 RepID=M0PKB9_9EURY|nr:helix-turn-helix transcriptional regulator [Halorubrum kocurii]EMA70393.1 DNA binding domain-containing protein [Halorubrum kocurii JCM 14978]
MSTECAANSFANCSAFQRDLLWVLSHENTRKTPSLKAELDDYYGESIRQSHLYQNLDELVDRGLVAKQARTNDYRLTESARRTLSARQAWQAGHRDYTTAGGHN